MERGRNVDILKLMQDAANGGRRRVAPPPPSVVETTTIEANLALTWRIVDGRMVHLCRGCQEHLNPVHAVHGRWIVAMIKIVVPRWDWQTMTIVEDTRLIPKHDKGFLCGPCRRNVRAWEACSEPKMTQRGRA